MMRRTLIAVATLSALVVVPALAQRAAPDFAEGQLWSVKADPPTTAKVIIDRIEDFGDRTAVHITLIDVPVPAGAAVAGRTTTIAHLAFDAETLRGSVDKLLGTRPPPPEFESGYAQWRAAKGGIFTITVPKTIEMLFQQVPRAK